VNEEAMVHWGLPTNYAETLFTPITYKLVTKMGFKQIVPYSSLQFCYAKSLVNPHISDFTVTVSAIEFWM